MNYAKYCRRLEGYRSKYLKMTPGQQRSWYARWIKGRICRMTEKIKAIDAGVGIYRRPADNYQIDPDELRRLRTGCESPE